MTTGWPHFCDSFSATARMAASGPLPAEEAVMMRTGLLGKGAASAAPVVAAPKSATAASAMKR